MAQYGAYTYESTESRALKSIRNDSYNKDMAKNLIQLNHNTEYMAQYMRKLQKGVDEAGANTIEQVQNFVADMLVLFGGGSMTAIDFGDLKYIFQAIGALFGFTNPDGSVKIPPNLIEAAWNFFSSYILPNGDFTEVINIIIDGAIGVVLDLFGEVPIIGEGVQQLAMVLSELRDMLLLVFDAINSVMNAFSIDMEDLGGITSFFTNLFSFLGDINFASPSFNLIEAASEFITNILIPTNLFPDIIEMAKNFLTHESPLNVLNLFGQIRPDQLGNIPISHLGVYKAELLINPKFNGAVSTSGQDVWFWNEDEGHDSPGSAWTDAESVEKELLSNYIPVSEGQTAHGKAWAKWSALVGSGILIRLDFALFNEVSQDVLVPVGTMQLDSISDPTTNANWTKLEGSLTIPENVTHVRLRLVVTNAATSGRVYWDDGSVWKSGLLAQWLVENLIPDLDSITNHIRSFIESALDVFGLVPSGELLDDIFSLSDEFSWLIDLANEGVGKATTALNNVGTLATKLLTNPVEALGEIPQVLVAGLSGTLSEFYQVRDILRGYVVTPINSAVQDIKDWWSSLGGKLQNLTSSGTLPPAAVGSPLGGSDLGQDVVNTVNDLVDGWTKFWNGVFGTPADATPRTAAEVEAAAASMSGDIGAVSNSNVYLTTLLTMPRFTPRWVSTGPQDDVSFPVSAINTTVTPALGELTLIPVTAEASRAYESVKFGLQSTTMTAAYVGVYKYAGDSLLLVSDLGNVKANLSPTKLQAQNLSTAISAARGETFYIGVLQVGGVASPMPATTVLVDLTEPLQEIPNWVGSKYGSGLSALPGSILSGAVVEQTPSAWGALGAEVGVPNLPVPVYYADNFNRSNGLLTTPWGAHPTHGGLSIDGNRLRVQGSPVHKASHYTLPFSGSRQRTKVNFTSESSGRFRVIIAMKDWNNYVELNFWRSTSTKELLLNTVIDGVVSTRSDLPQWGSYRVDAGSLLVEHDGNGLYYGRLEGTGTGPTLKEVYWEDTGGLFPISGEYNKAALYLQGMSSGGNIYFDNFEMMDW